MPTPADTGRCSVGPGPGVMRFEPESAERVAEPLESRYLPGSGRTALAHLLDAPDDFLARWGFVGG